MAPRPGLPEALLHAPFRGSAAIAARLITARRLHGASWVRVTRDVYVWRELEQTPELRAAALRLVLPVDAVACGRTAAWCHGVWAPAPGRPLPLEVARPVDSGSGHPAGTARRRLVLRFDDRSRLGSHGLLDDVVDVGGLPVTSPARTCFDLVRERNLVEAVVVVDAYAGSGLLCLPALDAYLRTKSRWPGVRQARMACALGTAYALSPGETRLRMIVVLVGFPEPWVNLPVAGPAGVLHPDLLLFDVPRPAGLEYDGAYHRTTEQGLADLRRENSLTAGSNLPLLRYDSLSVTREREQVVREVAELTGARPQQPLRDSDFWRPPARPGLVTPRLLEGYVRMERER